MLMLGFNLSKSYITLLDVSVFEESKKSECSKSFEALTEALDPIHQKKMTTLSMDGLSINWCMFRQLNESA